MGFIVVSNHPLVSVWIESVVAVFVRIGLSAIHRKWLFPISILNQLMASVSLPSSIFYSRNCNLTYKCDILDPLYTGLL